MLKQKSFLVAVAGIALVPRGYVKLACGARRPATPPAPDGGANSTVPGKPPAGLGRRGLQGMDLQGLMAISVCSATDNTDVVAKALGMTAADLRVALVSGKSIQDLATTKNVTIDTLRTALRDARKAQVAQAVKDGVITQAQADFITELLDRTPAATSAATPQAQGTAPAPDAGEPNNGNNARPGRGFPGRAFGPAFGLGMGVNPYVTVNNFVVAAKAINISCAALLVAVEQGHQSIAQVAQSKNVTAQTVIDALVKAQTAALDEDVKEGLITAAEKAGRSANLTTQMTAFVNGTRRGGLMGRSFQGQGGSRGNRDGQAQPGDPSDGGPMVPTAAAI